MPSETVQPFGPDIGVVDGPTVVSAGFRYPTRMAVLRVPDQGVFIWSPIALTEDLRAAVDAIGPVRFIVAPNSLHHLHLQAWQSAYPDALVYAPPGLRQRRKDIAFDGDLDDVPGAPGAPPPPWAATIDQVIVRGNLITTEVVFFHRPSGTVLFTDLIQNFGPDWFTGWRKIVARLDRMIGHEAQVPQKFRVAFTNRAAARMALAHIMAWPAEKVLMAHGTPIEKEGAAFIKRAFRWLTG